MLRSSITLFLFIVLFTAGSVSVSAQKTITVGGSVKKKETGGKKAPFAGAKIDCYRLDVREGCGSAVSDEAGKFSISTIDSRAKIVLAISGEGIAPQVVTNVRMDDSNTLEVSEGDGSVPNENAVREVALTHAKEKGTLTESQKEELKKLEIKRAEIEANNTKIESSNKTRARVLKEANEAFKKEDFGTAAVKFDEAYKVDTTFLEGAPGFLNNKAQSLRQRAGIAYNTAAKSKDSAQIRQAKADMVKDFAEALEALNLSFSIMEKTSKSGTNNRKGIKENKKFATGVVTSILKVMTQLNLNLAGSTEEETARGVKIFKGLLVAMPSDADVIAGLSLTLFASNSLQESLNYMAVFMDIAPKDHKRRKAISGLVEYLVKDEKLKPQKINE